jgi:hypothetical protein
MVRRSRGRPIVRARPLRCDRLRRVREKLARRLHGMPRRLREFDRSLALLATLRDTGWQRSITAGPVTAPGLPLPWYSYPATAWLERRLRPSDRVFEFGAGHSTLWYAARVNSVVSVDDNAAWVSRLQPDLPGNASVRLAHGDSYAQALDEENGEFDVIAVDGIRRNECAAAARGRLATGGLVIFDNSDRPENADGVATLMQSGFQHIDFVGFTSGYATWTCTSVFFADGQRWLSAGVGEFLGW